MSEKNGPFQESTYFIPLSFCSDLYQKKNDSKIVIHAIYTMLIRCIFILFLRSHKDIAKQSWSEGIYCSILKSFSTEVNFIKCFLPAYLL